MTIQNVNKNTIRSVCNTINRMLQINSNVIQFHSYIQNLFMAKVDLKRSFNEEKKTEVVYILSK